MTSGSLKRREISERISVTLSRETARKIKCPVLILHPQRDRVVPIEEGRSLVNLIPGSRFIEIDSSSHIPLADEPAWPRVVSEVRSFRGIM